MARNTLRRALILLEDERLIATVTSKGRIVLGRDTPAMDLDREPVYVSIAVELAPILGADAEVVEAAAWLQTSGTRPIWSTPGSSAGRCAVPAGCRRGG
ncbi:hypothetical protein AB0K60_30460 [Thermopolyspora sp. NPDC052614]|uniref:hypothetical protein n=1 Tax=Thermopolyspora sp. NPDC052614 TaxID=3155682 RepID=UPI0034360984